MTKNLTLFLIMAGFVFAGLSHEVATGIGSASTYEGFDLVLVNEALNSCVNIFNLYSGFLAYFTPKLAY